MHVFLQVKLDVFVNCYFGYTEKQRFMLNVFLNLVRAERDWVRARNSDYHSLLHSNPLKQLDTYTLKLLVICIAYDLCWPGDRGSFSSPCDYILKILVLLHM